MRDGVIQSHAYRELRAELKAYWQLTNAPCWIGNHPIDYDGAPNQPNSFELDHAESRRTRPDLALDPSNLRPSCVRCNRAKGARAMLPPTGETTEAW